MQKVWNGTLDRLRQLWRLLLLFALARLAAGVVAVALFDRDAVAWGWQVTAVVAAALAVYLLVALAVRRWAPPRRR